MHPVVDTHTHLCDPGFDADRGEVIERARQAGVARIVLVGETLEDARRNLALAAADPGLLPAAGLYPTHTDMDAAGRMTAFIRDHHRRLAAIGEVGLDLWVVRDPGEREIQRRIFEGFIDLSLELDLPLNVHSRSAGRQVVALLLEKGARRVQLHAFDARAATALPAVEAGYFFSIPPSIVRSRQKQKLVRQLPLECLLVETDSPVLGPEPGARNEPANCMAALRAIADIKNTSLETLSEILWNNTRRLYGESIPAWPH